MMETLEVKYETIMSNKMYSMEETIVILGFSRKTINSYVKKGSLVRVGRRDPNMFLGKHLISFLTKE